MSATIQLDAWQALLSHKVNCTKGCSRKKIVCPVGKLLLAKAMQQPEAAKKPLSFPFVARINERVLITLFNGQTIEAVVLEKSIQPREMYEKFDYETGTSYWRTGQDKLIGYEVMTDDKERHYVRPYQIKSLRVQGKAASPRLTEVDKGKTAPSQNLGDLIILRRG